MSITTNDGLTRSGTSAIPLWQQWADAQCSHSYIQSLLQSCPSCWQTRGVVSFAFSSTSFSSLCKMFS